jgi:hypothetical protein
MFVSPWLAVTALCMFGAANCFGVTAACVTTGTGSVLDSIDSANSGADTSNSLGCASLDLSFDNISLSNATASGGFTAATLANTAMFLTPGTVSLPNNTITGTSMTVNPTTSTNWTSSTAGSMTFQMDYSVTAHSSGGYGTGGNTPYTAPNPGSTWYFSQFTGAISGTVPNWPGSGNVQNVQAVTTFCLGAVSVTGCAAANLGTVTASIAESTQGGTTTISCSGTGSNYTCANGVVTILNTLRFSDIAFRTVVTGNEGNGTVTLNNFGMQFDQTAYTPEPSTFGLLGLALLLLASLAKSRNRMQQ